MTYSCNLAEACHSILPGRTILKRNDELLWHHTNCSNLFICDIMVILGAKVGRRACLGYHITRSKPPYPTSFFFRVNHWSCVVNCRELWWQDYHIMWWHGPLRRKVLCSHRHLTHFLWFSHFYYRHLYWVIPHIWAGMSILICVSQFFCFLVSLRIWQWSRRGIFFFFFF